MAKQEHNLKDFQRVLVVEGWSDQLFYLAVLKALGKEGLVFVKRLGGKQDLRLNLDNFLNPLLLKEKTHIAVIVDADEQPEGTYESLRSRLAEITGQTIAPAGEWTTGSPRIGLFIAPDAVTPGEIETLAWRAWSAIPNHAAEKGHIEEYIANMKRAGRSAKSPDKGLVGAMLAVLNDEDPRLGAGAREGIFDFTRPEFAALRKFLSGF